MTEADRADIVVYTQGWVLDRPMTDGEEPNALLHGRVFVNGHEVPQVLLFRVETKGADFARAEIHLAPSTLEVRPLTREEWDAL